MSRLILAANGNQIPAQMPGLDDFYVKIPTAQGVIMARNDVLMNELCCLSENEVRNIMANDIIPNNPKLGLIEDIVELTVEGINILQQVTGAIKDANIFKDKPPTVAGYQYPGKEKVLQDVQNGWFTYKDGALFWGAQHPLINKFPPLPGFSKALIGTFYANVPDEIIQALDPKYLNAVNNLVNVPTSTTPTKPGGSLIQNLFPGGVPGGGKGITVTNKPGGGISISTGEEWYKNPLVWVAGAGALYGLYRIMKRN